jgi:rhamnogalacturonan endolyase
MNLQGYTMRKRSSSRRSRFIPPRLDLLEPRVLLSLTHLYTFNDGTANDSVGTFHGSLFGGAAVSNGRLQLQNAGITSGSGSVQYARLPNGVLPASGSATIEVWYTTHSATPNWMRVFDFGNGSTGSYLFYSPKSGGNTARTALAPAGGTERAAETAAGTTAATGQMTFAAIVVDAAAGTLNLYLNGGWVQSAALNGQTIAAINEVAAYLGRSQFSSDAGFSGAIDELRIWDEALTPEAVAAHAVSGPAVPAAAAPVTRQVEKLDRGIVALPRSAGGIYVSWRMLGTDPSNIGFNLYRSAGTGAFVKLNGTPLTATTDYQDAAANRAVQNRYYVRPVINGVEGAPSETFTFAANYANPYLRIPLQVPPGGMTPTGETYTYSASDTSVGDVDGDGQYEFIVKWDPSNSKDNSQSGYTGNVYLDCYKMNGTRLWRIDLGVNIRAGAHYTQFQVYDFDGDGKAEMAVKTAPGTIDGQGNYVLMAGDDPTADYRNTSGYILTGPEYLTMFNGQTGAAMATIAYTPARVNISQWGDSYGNRGDRFLAGVAYLDGQRPSLIEARGYYGPQSGFSARNEIAAYNYRDGQFTRVWLFQAGQGINNNINSNYIGQGTHALSVADLDGDGKDEIVYGASAIDDDGRPMWSTGLGHGDALHVSDMDPNHPGIEIYQVHESAPAAYGGDYRDGRTGRVFFGIDGGGTDVGRGVAFDVDPRYPGYEMWNSANGSMYNVSGAVTSTARPGNYNFGIWWDADPLRELLDSTRIDKWNWTTNSLNRLLTGSGVSSNNGTKATPSLSGDILGDWREEVVWRATDSSELRIYSTTTPATFRLFTLMHDVQYREAIAWQNSAYNQPPHPSFFLGNGMTMPPQPAVYAVETPAVKGVTVQNGEVQRSNVTTLTLMFNTPVALAAGAVTVTRREAGGGSGAAPVTLTVSNPSGDKVTYVVSFGAASLPDGDYDLRVGAAGAKNLGGTPMAGDFAFSFFRLMADANGDHMVDAFDLNIVAANWQKATAGGPSVGDFNSDGTVDAFDLNMIAVNWQAGVTSTGGAMTAVPFVFHPGAVPVTDGGVVEEEPPVVAPMDPAGPEAPVALPPKKGPGKVVPPPALPVPAKGGATHKAGAPGKALPVVVGVKERLVDVLKGLMSKFSV